MKLTNQKRAQPLFCANINAVIIKDVVKIGIWGERHN